MNEIEVCAHTWAELIAHRAPGTHTIELALCPKCCGRPRVLVSCEEPTCAVICADCGAMLAGLALERGAA